MLAAGLLLTDGTSIALAMIGVMSARVMISGALAVACVYTAGRSGVSGGAGCATVYRRALASASGGVVGCGQSVRLVLLYPVEVIADRRH